MTKYDVKDGGKRKKKKSLQSYFPQHAQQA